MNLYNSEPLQVAARRAIKVVDELFRFCRLPAEYGNFEFNQPNNGGEFKAKPSHNLVKKLQSSQCKSNPSTLYLTTKFSLKEGNPLLGEGTETVPITFVKCP